MIIYKAHLQTSTHAVKMRHNFRPTRKPVRPNFGDPGISISAIPQTKNKKTATTSSERTLSAKTHAHPSHHTIYPLRGSIADTLFTAPFQHSASLGACGALRLRSHQLASIPGSVNGGKTDTEHPSALCDVSTPPCRWSRTSTVRCARRTSNASASASATGAMKTEGFGGRGLREP